MAKLEHNIQYPVPHSGIPQGGRIPNGQVGTQYPISNKEYPISKLKAEQPANPETQYPISNTEYPMSKLKAEQPVNPEIQKSRNSIFNIQYSAPQRGILAIRLSP
jgi:hypothetical protein